MHLGPLNLSLGKHRRRKLLAALAAVILVLLIAIRFSVAPLLKHELMSSIEKRLYAHLIIGDLSYHPPYGVVARNCQLVAINSSGQADLLDVEELSLRLAQLPLPGEPLVVEDLTIRGPSAHLVRTPEGFAGESGLLRPDTSGKHQPNNRKFSDLLRLRHLAIEDGQVVYEDRRRGNAPPTIWSRLSFHIDTSPQGPADYGFNIDANNLSAAQFQAKGSFNVDDLTATIDHFAVKAQAGEEGMDQLPPKYQEILRRYRVGGTLVLEGAAQGDVHHPQANSFSSTLSLQNGAAFSPEMQLKLGDLHFKILSAADAKGASLIISDFVARSGNGIFALKPGARFDIDARRWTWSLQNIDATLSRAIDLPATGGLDVSGSAEFTAAMNGPVSPDADLKDASGGGQLVFNNLSVQPPTFPLPVSNISGPPIRLARGMLILRDLQAHYGRDRFQLSSARVALGQLKHGVVRCSDLNGVLSFHPPNADYPPPLDVAFRKAQPGGEFYFTGHGAFDRARRKPLDYDLLLSCDNTTVAVLNPRFNVFQIKFDAEATQDLVQVPNFQCRTLDGRLRLERGRFAMAVPNAFSANVFIDRISVPKVVALAVHPKSGGVNLQGLADVHSSISGKAHGGAQAVVDSLQAEGQFELYGGDLWDIPALKKITSSSHLAKDALSIGQAAALFRVRNRIIELQNAVVSAPAAGVQGYGTIGFDGNLNIYAIVVLLSDWRQKLKGTSMDFLADTLGTVQQTLNEATEHLLYQYHVYGPASDPETKAEGIPDLQKNSAQDVTTMLRHTDADRPITLLNANGAAQ
ncbi:MAG: hypothetical protein ABSB74_00640 [Tepidisphaeraceae bacterium]